MDIFSGSDLVQQRAHTSPSSPATSSSSLSPCVGAAHTCAGTCSHGPHGGYRTCLRIKNCCKCKNLGGPQTKGGQNQNWLPHPCLLGGPKEGGNATSLLHSWGSPNKEGQNQKWLPHPCLLGDPKEGGSATSPLRSRRSPNKGTQSEVKTYARGNNDAPSVSKYGSLVRPNAQIVALCAHCAKCGPLGIHFSLHISRVKYNFPSNTCPMPQAPCALFAHTTSTSLSSSQLDSLDSSSLLEGMESTS